MGSSAPEFRSTIQPKVAAAIHLLEGEIVKLITTLNPIFWHVKERKWDLQESIEIENPIN